MMKTIFVVNSAAAKGKPAESLQNAGEHTEIYITKAGRMRLRIVGEITDSGKTEFTAVHQAFRFVVPRREDI